MKLLERYPARVQMENGKIYTVLYLDQVGNEIILDEKGAGVSTTRDLGVNLLRFVRAELKKDPDGGE